MIIQQNCEFVKDSDAPIVSKDFPNASGDVLTIQVYGANGLYQVEGRNTSNGDWVPLAGINLSNFSTVIGGVKAPGLYEFGVIGIRAIRVRVEEVEGKVSIFGQIISSEET
jgi:hypothetical protein